ncbi:MAG: shikimate kinase [Candidatus Gastranaerophilales bacterium]|nr:shikimate kinase [Candidatus Gastranaerophilales bacterium]
MKNIALIGLMGSGKTTIGVLLAKKLGVDFVDIDEKIEQKEKTSITKIFETKGEEYFRQVESTLLQDYGKRQNLVISTGGGAVQKEENLQILKSNCTIIYLKASPNELFSRIKDDTSRPLLQTLNPLLTLEELLKKREKNYLMADIIINTEAKTTEQILDEIIKNVKS